MFEMESESEMFLFDPYQKYIQSNNETILDQGFQILTLSDFRTYIYVRNSQTVATPVRIYTYTDFAIEIWGF